jgi:hypothetical protein
MEKLDEKEAWVRYQMDLMLEDESVADEWGTRMNAELFIDE